MSKFSEVAQEAFATARSNVPILETLQISHSSSEDIFLIKNTEDLELPLAFGENPVLFRAAGIDFTLPETSRDGVSDLGVAIANTDLLVSDYLVRAQTVPEEPIILTYRPYLASDLSAPQMDPPLRLSFAGATIDAFQVSGTATITDITNKRFLNEIYSLENHPAL